MVSKHFRTATFFYLKNDSTHGDNFFHKFGIKIIPKISFKVRILQVMYGEFLFVFFSYR